MRHRRSRFASALVFCTVLCAPCSTSAASSGSADPSPAAQAAPQARAASREPRRSVPIGAMQGFVENEGQWAPEILYVTRAGRVQVSVLADALVFQPLPKPVPLPYKWERDWDAPVVKPELDVAGLHPVVMRFESAGAATRAASLEGVGERTTKHHFFLGSARGSNARAFDAVRLDELAPGVDLLLKWDAGRLEYDLELEPGAKPESLALVVENARIGESDDASALAIETAMGTLVQRIPAAWDIKPGTQARRQLDAVFVRIPSSDEHARFGLALPGRDPSRAAVIDPTLVFLTYVGGANQELWADSQVDSEGASYLYCRGISLTPTTPGAFMPTPSVLYSAWIGKVSPDGSSLVWGTYLGGSDVETPEAMDVAMDGSVVVTGSTWSPDFPVTPGCLQPLKGSPDTSKADMFISRISADGSELVWSTFYGNVEQDHGQAIVALPDNDVVVGGKLGNGLPAPTEGAFDTAFDTGDLMMLRVSADGSTRVFQTFTRGTMHDMECDADGNVYTTGIGTSIPPFGTPGTIKPVGVGDSHVSKMDASGTSKHWATYLGGDEGGDTAVALTIDAAGAIYVVGYTSASDFPTTPGAFQTQMVNPQDGFVCKLLPNATAFVWSTLVGYSGSGTGNFLDVAVDAAGTVFAWGHSNESFAPTTSDAYQSFYKGPFPSSDAYLSRFDSLGEKQLYGSWFGGASGGDSGVKIGLDMDGQPRMILQTSSFDLPSTNGAFDANHNGFEDLAVLGFAFVSLPWRILGSNLEGSVEMPNLAGTGELLPGTATRLAVRGALANKPAWGVVGFSRLDLPLFGGTVVPTPDLVVPLKSNALGQIDVQFAWPSIAPDTTVYFQFWCFDPGAAHLFSATNAVEVRTQ